MRNQPIRVTPHPQNDLVNFVSFVSEGGYAWTGHDSTAQLRPLSEVHRATMPLFDERGAFRTFAACPKTRDGFVGFANRYGPLTLEATVQHWERTHEAFTAALQWLQLARSSARELLKERSRLRRQDDGWWYMRPETRFADRIIRRDTDLWDEVDVKPSQLTADVVRRLVLLYLQKFVNKHITAAPALPRLLYDRATAHLQFHVRPTSLESALWVQFAQQVEVPREYRRCDYCGDYFEISPEGRRRQTRFCTDVHRVFWHRRHPKPKPATRRMRSA